MSEQIIISGQTKQAKYEALLPQIFALTESETSWIANLANTSAALKETFEFFWVGFYLVDGEQLVLGPFQGPIACTRIAFGKGVCGASWEQKTAILVPDVEAFPGHIACSSLSRSEVVLPLMKNGEVIGVLDVDSDQLNAFDEVDVKFLTELCTWLVSLH
ncbi:MAG: GAF domain-containing protein [Crocinitomicaceae bacterium]|nr:GAF domain-containing protein [Crocinitomicaceae bacterium]MBP6032989.1 GAF domain-containing protein [Crocinitomicaceae bacterium]